MSGELLILASIFSAALICGRLAGRLGFPPVRGELVGGIVLGPPLIGLIRPAGQSPKSLQALADLRSLCDEHLAGRYEIEVIDLVENPSLAQSDDIAAIPTLVRRLPEPLRKIIGDLSNTERVLVSLRVRQS